MATTTYIDGNKYESMADACNQAQKKYGGEWNVGSISGKLSIDDEHGLYRTIHNGHEVYTKNYFKWLKENEEKAKEKIKEQSDLELFHKTVSLNEEKAKEVTDKLKFRRDDKYYFLHSWSGFPRSSKIQVRFREQPQTHSEKNHLYFENEGLQTTDPVTTFIADVLLSIWATLDKPNEPIAITPKQFYQFAYGLNWADTLKTDEPLKSVYFAVTDFFENMIYHEQDFIKIIDTDDKSTITFYVNEQIFNELREKNRIHEGDVLEWWWHSKIKFI